MLNVQWKTIVDKDNKIKTVYAGNDFSQLEIEKIIKVPSNFSGVAGEDIRCWDKDWNKLSAEECIEKGYTVLLLTQKIVDHKIVEKTIQEQYDEGVYIPKEGCIVFNNKIWELASIEQYRNLKVISIQKAYDNEMAIGHFKSKILGIDIDCRKSAIKNDLSIVENLIKQMTVDSTKSIIFNGVKESATATKENLETLEVEMIRYTNELYNKKRSKFSEVEKALTIQDIEAVSW